MSTARRLNWGCGGTGEPGWVNSDVKSGPGVDLPCDIRDGLPVDDDLFDYAVSVHALQEIPLSDQVRVMAELRRVIRPGGVLRLVLPDLEKGFAAYRRGDRDYFLVPDAEATSIGAKLVTQILWYGYSRTVYVPDAIEEMLRRAGFDAVHHVAAGRTASEHEGIVELDQRESESLFVEAVR